MVNKELCAVSLYLSVNQELLWLYYTTDPHIPVHPSPRMGSASEVESEAQTVSIKAKSNLYYIHQWVNHYAYAHVRAVTKG